MTPRDEKRQAFIAAFIAEYLIDLNAKQAFIRAGGSKHPATAEVEGSRLLRNPKVRAAIDEAKQKQLRRADLSAARVLEELRRLAFEDRTEILACKTVEDVRKLRPELRTLIEGFEVYDANLANVRDGKTERVRRLRTPSKLQALNLLAMHFRLLSEVEETQAATEASIARLRAGRERVAALRLVPKAKAG